MALTLQSVVLGATGEAALPQAASPSAAPATPAAPDGKQREDEEHHTKGEIRFLGKWLPVTEVYRIYRDGTEEAARTLADKNPEAIKKRLSEIASSLATIEQEWRTASDPVQRLKAQAEAQRTAAARVLAERPPAPPRLQPEPARPIRAFYRNEYEYLAAVEAWALVVDRVRQENARLEAAYQQLLASYQARMQEASLALRQAEAVINKCDTHLSALMALRKDKERPLLVERTQSSEELRKSQATHSAAFQRAKAASDALQSVPVRVILRQGITVWQGGFRTRAELQALHDSLKAEITAARRNAELLGVPSTAPSKPWKHPREDELASLATALAELEYFQSQSVNRGAGPPSSPAR